MCNTGKVEQCNVVHNVKLHLKKKKKNPCREIAIPTKENLVEAKNRKEIP